MTSVSQSLSLLKSPFLTLYAGESELEPLLVSLVPTLPLSIRFAMKSTFDFHGETATRRHCKETFCCSFLRFNSQLPPSGYCSSAYFGSLHFEPDRELQLAVVVPISTLLVVLGHFS